MCPEELQTESTDKEGGDLSEAQMDELVAKSEGKKSYEIPMSKGDIERNQTRSEREAATAKSEAKSSSDKIDFIHNGKTVSGTRDQLIKWAQMGYDAPQRFQKLNQEKAQIEQMKSDWEKQRQTWEQQWGTYAQVDKWAKENPEQWHTLQSQWRQQTQAQPGQGEGPLDKYAPVIQSLKSEVSEIKNVANTWQEFVSQEKVRQEDQQLEQEVKSIQVKHPDLDWDSLDENGKTLEYKVLEHAQQNGIKSFKTAFNDFYHDELIKRAEAQAKQNVSKEIQTKTKLGILGTTPTPRRGFSQPKDIKKQSYNDLMNEALEEIRSGQVG